MLGALTVNTASKPALKRGFGLIELMVTLVVLAILMAIAAPSFSDLLDRRRVSGLANEISTDIQWVRTEALKRNRLVTLTFSDIDHIVTIATSTGPVVIKTMTYAAQHPGMSVAVFGNTSPIVFNPMLGRLADPAGGAHGVTISGQRGHQIGLEISPVGSVSRCGNFGGLPACL